jgi:hypothetical protein
MMEVINGSLMIFFKYRFICLIIIQCDLNRDNYKSHAVSGIVIIFLNLQEIIKNNRNLGKDMGEVRYI